MTKAELIAEFKELETEKGVHIDGIYYNSKKCEIENAIECLKCPDGWYGPLLRMAAV